MAELQVGMGRLMRPAAYMRRQQGIPAAPAGPVMEELPEPIRSSIAAAPTEGVFTAEVFMEGDLTEGMVEAMEAAGTGDRICAGA